MHTVCHNACNRHDKQKTYVQNIGIYKIYLCQVYLFSLFGTGKNSENIHTLTKNNTWVETYNTTAFFPIQYRNVLPNMYNIKEHTFV